ncbi:hypothetical protein DY000_02020904 [Brassica cretica]|uniref:Uncharacterized protein n=1 Tax=Brassica cretica TaxID=69181 RepID=A0ABQ7EMN8_BRACR|nr:hypothetical protein DY000_02020904 [Brassica cretica]
MIIFLEGGIIFKRSTQGLLYHHHCYSPPHHHCYSPPHHHTGAGKENQWCDIAASRVKRGAKVAEEDDNTGRRIGGGVCDGGSWKSIADGVTDSVFEASMVEDPEQTEEAEVELYGKGG